jgi:hypothetical protein
MKKRKRNRARMKCTPLEKKRTWPAAGKGDGDAQVGEIGDTGRCRETRSSSIRKGESKGREKHHEEEEQGTLEDEDEEAQRKKKGTDLFAIPLFFLEAQSD